MLDERARGGADPHGRSKDQAQERAAESPPEIEGTLPPVNPQQPALKSNKVTFGPGGQQPFSALGPDVVEFLDKIGASALTVERQGSREHVEMELDQATSYTPPKDKSPPALRKAHFSQKVSYTGHIDPATGVIKASSIRGVQVDAKFGFIPLPRVKLCEVTIYPDNNADVSVERAGIPLSKRVKLPAELARLIRASIADVEKLRP